MSQKLTPIANIRYLSNRVIALLGCNPSPMTLLGTNSYLVGSGKERILIDTGQSGFPEFQSLLKKVLAETKSSITKIIITHYHHDHLGGLSDVRKLCDHSIPAYKFDFVSPELKEKLEPSELAEELSLEYIKDKTVFAVEGATLTAHYNPGHCDDHMVVWLEEEQAIFSADSVLGEGTTVFTNLSQYMKSLEEIKSMKPKVIYPGHGPVVTDPDTHVGFYIKHRQDRENQVIDLLQAGPQSATSIVKVLYKAYPVSLHMRAAEGIVLHLHKLEHEGRIACTPGEDNKQHETVWSMKA